ncbi:MAG: flagellar basal-body MS-ring/collar protein FliF [Pigmentiphaga sp.]|uniref:flagellar basal-body MS-ring/collar protein FliF n=1 Tax=Pigmentiphaga sp. TaxID=1977564 RepID=UPI0029AAE7FB|nr:flagellar basal-body MS-ring/collar protein FliF [Pigmentiphaga sp.]MDX3904139.1 flagellar basal-body MS-ring/collar protein FliF [Pigmentiphaga sp.]
MADDTQNPPAPPVQRGNQLLQAFGRLPTRHRLALLVGVPMLVAIVAATLLWSRAPEYRVLFSGLSDQDGGTIIAALQQQKIPYRVADGGTAILVPPDQVHEVRLRLASQGLPRAGGVGFELMDNSRLGLTQFQEQVNYQRALEGELARSIQSLGTVKSARVHLAIPKPSIFMREKNRPTASVLVQMLPGRVLERGQVAGIVHLVSSSVPELAPGAVSVVDQTGALLSADENDPNGLDASQLEYLRTLERQYTRRISELISPIVGAQNLRAQVAIDLDFSRQEQTDEIYRPNGGSPDQAAIRSRQSSESREPAQGLDGGVPGALSNTPPGVAVAPTTGGAPTNPPAPGTPAQPPAQNLKRADTTNYELDKTVRYVREPVGRIKRLSAAVVVNYRASTGKGETPNIPVPDEELAQIKALVSEAVGFDPQRRDSISVISIPFNEVASEASAEQAFWQQPEFIDLARDIGVALVVALAVLYLIIGVIRPAIKQLTAPQPADPATPPAEAQAAAAVADTDPVDQPEDPLEKIRMFARENPQIVATVIRQWVNDAP